MSKSDEDERLAVAPRRKPPLQAKLAAELETTNERAFEVLLLIRGPGLNATVRKQLLAELKSVNQTLRAITKRLGTIADVKRLEKAGWTRSDKGWSHPNEAEYCDTDYALDLQEWFEENARESK